MAQFDCFKCGGSGEVAFRHIANGICFQCSGTGKLAFRGKIKPFTAPPCPTEADFVAEERRPTMKQIMLINRLAGDVARRNGHCSVGTLQSWFHSLGNDWTSPTEMDWRCVDRALASKAIDLAKRELQE